MAHGRRSCTNSLHGRLRCHACEPRSQDRRRRSRNVILLDCGLRTYVGTIECNLTLLFALPHICLLIRFVCENCMTNLCGWGVVCLRFGHHAPSIPPYRILPLRFLPVDLCVHHRLRGTNRRRGFECGLEGLDLVFGV